jgi:oligopeptide/dipeptide ABC transporter ATP-binding protein
VSTPLLEVRDLRMTFPVKHQDLVSRLRGRRPDTLKAVDGVDLVIERGESVGIVGESGCGKSTLGRCIVGLYRPTSGRVLLDGTPVASGEHRTGSRRAQIIFQDPYSSLNPRMSVQQAIVEPMRVHGIATDRAELERRCRDLLDLVRLSRNVAHAYPRQLSGGQRQRVSIARALAVEPELLIADEPVSSLDVSVQATVLNLLADLRKELGLTLVLIAHNMAVVRHVCDRTVVMYLGRVVESGPTERVFSDPRHPYTRALLTAVPRLVPGRMGPEAALTGDPPSPIHLPAGCRFHPRCPIAADVCSRTDPPLETAPDPDHAAACLFAWNDPSHPAEHPEWSGARPPEA